MGPLGRVGILERDERWRRHPGSCEGEATEVWGKCQPAPNPSDTRNSSFILHF